MIQRIAIYLLITGVLLTGSPAPAQQPAKIFRIGYLSAVSPTDQTLGGFRRVLSELGYVEGKNLLIEYRFAEGKLDRLPALAADLVRLKVDVIVTRGPSATRPAKDTTTTIPIVMMQDPDPVGSGFVASLAQPGGNITGLSSYSAELNGKRLELLKETVPKLSRVAVLEHSTNPGNAQALKDIDLAAGMLRVNVLRFDIRDPKSIESVFRAANKERAEGIVVVNNPFVGAIRKQITSLAVKYRLPAIYFNSFYVDDGGLMSYAASDADQVRRAAVHVDKILKGAKPADIPVEQPMKFEFIVSLIAAKQIGLTIPPNVLVRAQKVIR